MFIGPPGVGKNTLYWIFATKFLGREITIDTEDGDREYLEVNAGKEGGIETVRNEIAEFASFVVRDHKKCCLIDEFDNPTYPMQMALKHVIEHHADKCHFCFIMNEDAKIIPALRSRCYVAYFTVSDVNELATYFLNIAHKENVEFEDPNVVLDIVEYYKGDLRSMLVDCLEALIGRTMDGSKATKLDLWKIYERGTKSIAKKIFDSDNKIDLWANLWKAEGFDNRKFLVDYMKLYKGNRAKFFAKIDSRLRRGCNPMIQMSALFSVLGD